MTDQQIDDAFELANRLAGLRRVVIESPCAASATRTFQENDTYLQDCLRDSLSRGEAPIASHGLFAFSYYLDDDDPAQRKAGMEAGWAWIDSADAVVFYVDHGMSGGMTAAYDYARSQSAEIIIRKLGEPDGAHVELPDPRPAIASGNIPEVASHSTEARYPAEKKSVPDE